LSQKKNPRCEQGKIQRPRGYYKNWVVHTGEKRGPSGWGSHEILWQE